LRRIPLRPERCHRGGNLNEPRKRRAIKQNIQKHHAASMTVRSPHISAPSPQPQRRFTSTTHIPGTESISWPRSSSTRAFPHVSATIPATLYPMSSAVPIFPQSNAPPFHDTDRVNQSLDQQCSTAAGISHVCPSFLLWPESLTTSPRNSTGEEKTSSHLVLFRFQDLVVMG
jgi:hypothetical protein